MWLVVCLEDWKHDSIDTPEKYLEKVQESLYNFKPMPSGFDFPLYKKGKLEELKQSLLDVRPFYEYVNENGSTERWDLPNSVEDTKKEIQDMINTGEGEITELESKRNLAFDVLKEKNYEHYI